MSETRHRMWRRQATVLAMRLVLGAGLASAGDLDGVWESVVQHEDGIGTRVEFRAKGKVCVSPGAATEMPYRVDGNEVVFVDEHGERFTAAGIVPEMSITIDREGGFLVHASAGFFGPMALERVDGSLGLELPLGTWKYAKSVPGYSRPRPADAAARQMLEETRYTLTPDGRFVLWLPFRTDCGKYSLDGNALAMKVRPHGRLTGELVESGRLLLYAPDGTSEEFRPLAR